VTIHVSSSDPNEIKLHLEHWSELYAIGTVGPKRYKLLPLMVMPDYEHGGSKSARRASPSTRTSTARRQDTYRELPSKLNDYNLMVSKWTCDHPKAVLYKTWATGSVSRSRHMSFFRCTSNSPLLPPGIAVAQNRLWCVSKDPHYLTSHLVRHPT
jgi:hypothetical protein